MIIPISILYFSLSSFGILLGILRRSVTTLLVISVLWWVGALVSAYSVYLAWMDRSFSENWAMIGFLIFALPYAAITIVLIHIELYLLRKWEARLSKQLRANLLALLTFLVLQIIIGFVSA